ncbi:tetratricopeptide repeat protein [Streptomyces sp. NPDC097595]|uniref:tetratricopeptide repeat protein n=1 Tax=Streptomyces sp. NPDC097595 TaxID=3366090 RepID=UPI003803B8C1
MADSDNYEVEDLLEDLADRHLITADEVPGRYRIHDLMRLFAREQAHTQESHQEIENNIHRLLEWHLQVLEAGGPSLHSWVRLEKDSLIAGVLAATTRGWNELSWRTANELAAYHSVESDYVDWITCNKAGLISARKCESLEGKSLMLGGLGQASRQLRKFSDAQSYLRESLQGFRDLGDVHRCAQILWEIGKTAASQWDIPQAISAFTESVEIAQSVGHPYDAARAFHALGHLYSGIGRHKESLEFFEKELEVTTRNDANPRYQGFTYQGMAACLASSSMSEQSLDAYDKSIAAAREGGDRESLRIRLTRKAKVLESMGRLTEAYSVHREAIETARVDRDASGLIWARHNLADTFVREGKMGDADSIFSQIIETGEVEGDPGALIGALHCWGDSYARRGETRRAIELLDKAIQASRDNEQEQNLIEISLCRSRVEENQGAYSTGLPYTLEAVSVARSYGSARILAKCLKRLGALLEKLEEEKDATESFEEQIRLEVLMQQWSEALISANKLSSLWEKLGDPSKAEKYAASASEYSAKSIARGSIFPEQIEK